MSALESFKKMSYRGLVVVKYQIGSIAVMTSRSELEGVGISIKVHSRSKVEASLESLGVGHQIGSNRLRANSVSH